MSCRVRRRPETSVTSTSPTSAASTIPPLASPKATGVSSTRTLLRIERCKRWVAPLSITQPVSTISASSAVPASQAVLPASAISTILSAAAVTTALLSAHGLPSRSAHSVVPTVRPIQASIPPAASRLPSVGMVMRLSLSSRRYPRCRSACRDDVSTCSHAPNDPSHRIANTCHPS